MKDLAGSADGKVVILWDEGPYGHSHLRAAQLSPK